jgi:hypothetical protein
MIIFSHFHKNNNTPDGERIQIPVDKRLYCTSPRGTPTSRRIRISNGICIYTLTKFLLPRNSSPSNCSSSSILFPFPFIKKANSRNFKPHFNCTPSTLKDQIPPKTAAAASVFKGFIFTLNSPSESTLLVLQDDAQSPKPRRLGASLNREPADHSLATENPNPIPASNSR